MSDGTLVIKKAGKWLSKFDKLTGIDNYMRKGKDFTRLSTSGGLKQFTDLGDSLLDKLKLVDKNVVLKGSKQAFKESVKGIGKGTLKSAGGALKKSVSFGINGIVKDAKALVNAKGYWNSRKCNCGGRWPSMGCSSRWNCYFCWIRRDK